MAGEWIPSNSNKRTGSEAFGRDWSSYENRAGNMLTISRQRQNQIPQSYQNNLSSTRAPNVSVTNNNSPMNTMNPYKSNNSPMNTINPYKNQISSSSTISPHSNKPIISNNNGRVSNYFSPMPQQPPPPNGNNYSRIDESSSSFIDPSQFTNSMRNPKPKVTIPPEDSGTLNEEQRLVVESVLSGYSTFFTGPAGSGKSHILSSILRLNEESTNKKRIVVTATTGLAACNISGITIHSFSGIGVDESSLDKMVSRVMNNPHAKKRWKECDVLIIDEVSMMSAKFLDNLNFIASRVRSDRRVFGGLQLVLCGDFFQLPPVDLKKSGFAFEAKCWGNVLQCSILLKKIFRQNGDEMLMNILNEARIGELSEESVRLLKLHGGQKNVMKENITKAIDVDNSDNENDSKEMIKPTLLECKNHSVDQANHRELDKLQGETFVFQSRDRAINQTYEKQLRNYPATETITLKKGAQVILLKNIDPDAGLVNGSRGVIVDFRKHASPMNDLPRGFKNLELPVVLFENDVRRLIEPAEWSNKVGDTTVCARVQIPLKLAWALSVHKSQGMTIPHLTVNLRGVFEYGQAYVALSRATKLSLLTILGLNASSIRAHPKVKTFYDILEGKHDMPPVRKVNQNITSLPPSSQSSLTSEQIQRIEENRKRALEIQRQRQLMQHQ